MSTYLDDLPPNVRADYALVGNQSMFSLRQMVKALGIHPLLNTPDDNARLAAAKRVLKWNAKSARPRSA